MRITQMHKKTSRLRAHVAEVLSADTENATASSSTDSNSSSNSSSALPPLSVSPFVFLTSQRRRQESYEISQILDISDEDNETKFLVRWKGYDKSADSWVPLRDMHADRLVIEFLLDDRRKRRLVSSPPAVNSQKGLGPTNPKIMCTGCSRANECAEGSSSDSDITQSKIAPSVDEGRTVFQESGFSDDTVEVSRVAKSSDIHETVANSEMTVLPNTNAEDAENASKHIENSQCSDPLC
ncbi:hypothetical protein AB6A40_009309 [Gnathostoma spinigerum]|uniref:Chromo domain-containing protein n=1 Tax=Gnathostoma spinigerum TaxID=75299 RepID=A0ABD6ESU8_9BILA